MLMTNNNAVYATYATYRNFLLKYNTIDRSCIHCCKWNIILFLLELIDFTLTFVNYADRLDYLIDIRATFLALMHPTDWKLECQPSWDILRTMIVIWDKSEIATDFSTRKFQFSMAPTEIAWSLTFKLKMYRKIRGIGKLGTKRSK